MQTRYGRVVKVYGDGRRVCRGGAVARRGRRTGGGLGVGGTCEERGERRLARGGARGDDWEERENDLRV